jgi:hypothetical protein
MRQDWGSILMTTLMLAGCAPDAAKPIDPAPTGFARPAEYPLGDAEAATEEHEAARITRLLEPHFGKPSQSWYVRQTPFRPELIRADYARRLGAGWEPLQLGWAEPGATAFAFTDGSRALAVLIPATSLTRAPHALTVLVFGGRS